MSIIASLFKYKIPSIITDRAPYILHSSGVPSALPSSGNIGANGALSGLTALPATYSTGIWLYFPAGSVYAGSIAGSYWAVMSSPTAGTVFDNVLTIPGPLTAPVNPTPIVAAGPGAFTQTTGTTITLFGATIPGNSIGNNGALRLSSESQHANSAGSKTVALRLDGANAASSSVTTTAALSLGVRVANRGANNSQLVCPVHSAASATAPVTLSVDTTVDKTLSVSGNMATATDFVVLESLLIEVIPEV